MSCERTAHQVGNNAAVAAGLPGTTSKSANTTGIMIARHVRRAHQKTAPVATAVVSLAADKDKMDAAYSLGVIGAGTTKAVKIGLNGSGGGITKPTMKKMVRTLDQTVRQAERPPADLGALINKSLLRSSGLSGIKAIAGTVAKYTIEAGSRVIGTRLAEVTKTRDLGTLTHSKRRLVFLKAQQDIPLWKSTLTGRLNQNDLIGGIFDSNHIVSSQGTMFKFDNVTWHRGTIVLSMPEGRRTITHLQTLKMPATHYYFDRSLRDEQAVAIASNKVQAESLPGYVGTISRSESLMPIWARTKATLILTRLHWPPAKRKKAKGVN